MPSRFNPRAAEPTCSTGRSLQSASGPGGVANSFSSATTVNDGACHHVAYVHDRSAAGATRLYIDGDLDASQNNSGARSWPAAQPLEFGRSHGAFWRRYNGRMDDVRVYDSSLSSADVLAIVNETVLCDRSSPRKKPAVLARFYCRHSTDFRSASVLRPAN